MIASSDWLYCGISTGAKSDRKRGRAKLAPGHADRSPVDPMTRSTYSLTVRVPSRPSRIGAMYQGIRTSTVQPSASSPTAWRQLPSQSSLNWFSLLTIASAMPPVEAMVKL